MQLKNTVASLLSKILFIVFILVMPLYGISQGPSSPTVDGGTPTGESGAVPFDDNMNLLFLAFSLVFAGVVTVKQLQKKVIANQ